MVLWGFWWSVTPGLPVISPCQDGLSMMVVRWAAQTLIQERPNVWLTALLCINIIGHPVTHALRKSTALLLYKPLTSYTSCCSAPAVLSSSNSFIFFKIQFGICGHLSKPWKVGKYHARQCTVTSGNGQQKLLCSQPGGKHF